MSLNPHNSGMKDILTSLSVFGYYDRTAGAIILRICYGYHIKERNDPFVALAAEALEQFSLATVPGEFLVDFVPACTSFLYFNLLWMNLRFCSEAFTSLVSWSRVQMESNSLG